MTASSNDMRQMTPAGRRIEDESFSIIDREVGPHGFPLDQWAVVRRIIHATGDLQFASLVQFHPAAVRSGIEALRQGCSIIADVKMITAGLNQERLGAYGCRVHSCISDDEVMARARENNSTRAVEAMRKAQRLGILNGAIVAVGNAPTALLEMVRLVRQEQARPALVIGVPVGFVSAAESKEAAMGLEEVPYIVSRGRKGGSPVAVAIIHALLLLAAGGAA